MKDVLRGTRRKLGVAPDAVQSVSAEDLERMVAVQADDLRGLRNRALLLVGFVSSCRRSELVALTMADVQRTDEGVLLNIRRSNTDQEGVSRRAILPYFSNPQLCPVRALSGWLAGAGITEGVVFRSVRKGGRVGGELDGKDVERIVKEAARQAGLEGRYGAHSLRAGFVTLAARNDATESAIMKQTGHRSSSTLRGYIRDANVWRGNAAMKLGL